MRKSITLPDLLIEKFELYCDANHCAASTKIADLIEDLLLDEGYLEKPLSEGMRDRRRLPRKWSIEEE